MDVSIPIAMWAFLGFILFVVIVWFILRPRLLGH